MQQAFGAVGRARILSGGREFAAIFAAAFRRHRFIHALALLALTLAIAVGSRTGNLPDFGVVASYGFNLAVAFWVGGTAYGIYRLYRLAVVERHPAPLGAFLGSFGSILSDRERLANTVNGLAAVLAFISAFSVLKGAIAILTPFAWDPALIEVDRALHLGHLPHEWLTVVTASPLALSAINFAYNFWFVVLVGTLFTAVMAGRDTVLRHQFLITFMLVWLIGGFMVAAGLSSAGPCYVARLGLGDAYRPLMDALHAADGVFPVWALSTQDMLWNGFVGNTQGSMGISAFPSMHVASATLFALYGWRRSRRAGAVLWVFTGLIELGSVVLGWHYAVDGYAGAAIALLVWKAVGKRLARRQGEEAHARASAYDEA